MSEKRPRGRPKGSLSKATKDIRALAQTYTDEALRTLAKIMSTGESESARVAAAREMLDRGHGKSMQPIGGTDDAPPIQHSVRVEFVKAKGG